MPFSCAVATCTNTGNCKRRRGSELSFHRFPKDPQLVAIWTERCGRSDYFNDQSARICSDHFTPEDYERDLKSELLGIPVKKRLKTGAIPSEFPIEETPIILKKARRKIGKEESTTIPLEPVGQSLDLDANPEDELNNFEDNMTDPLEISGPNHENPPVISDVKLCSCCCHVLTLDDLAKNVKVEVEDVQTTDPENLQTSSTPRTADILSMIFEYPSVARLEKTVFGNEKQDFELCSNCSHLLLDLYPLYRRLVETLKHDSRIWKTLEKIGNEPILPMLVYDHHHEADQVNPEEISNDSPEYPPTKSGVRRTRRPRKIPPKRIKSNSAAPGVPNSEIVRENDGEEAKNFPLRTSDRKVRQPRKKYVYADSSSEGSGEEDFQQDDQNFDKMGTKGQVIGPGRMEGSTIIVDHESEKPANLGDNFDGEQENENNGVMKNLRSRSRGKIGKKIVLGASRKTKKSKSSIKKSNSSEEDAQVPEDLQVIDPINSELEDETSWKSRQRKKDTRKRVRPNRRKEFWIQAAKDDPSRTCDICGKSFYYPRFMQHHRMTVHEGKKPYECKACGKGFTQKFILKKHLCDYSQITAGDREYLKLLREEQLRHFECDVCGKKFKERCHLNVHKQNHREDRPFKCDKCDKSFRRHDHLRMHMRVVHTDERRFVCTLCGRSFKIMSNLRAHEKRHNNPEEKHLCSVCGKSFDTVSLVNRHQQTHEDVLPFQCDVCGKRFKMKDYLGQHLRKGKSCKPKGMPKIVHSVGEEDNNNSSSQPSGSRSADDESQSKDEMGLAAVSVASSQMAEDLIPAPVNMPAVEQSQEFLFPYNQLFENRSLTEL